MLFEKQKYQEDCVANIINILDGYDFKQNDATLLRQMLEEFYKVHKLPVQEISDKLNLDILMETGTGKTFTYLKAIYELNKNYGLKKFIIFVPRKAIREGTIQNIDLTSDYFTQEYGKRLKKYTYDGKKSLGPIKSYYINNKDELSVLVLTNSSIDKDKNILNAPKEDLFDVGSDVGSVVKAIAGLKPIIIIDEPHLLKGEQFINAFNKFNSLYLRFGATFPDAKKDSEHKLSNMAYSLDSISAFKNYLVKKIRVTTIINSQNTLKVYTADKDKATLLYFKDNEEHKKVISKGQDLGLTTGLTEYKGISVVKTTSKGVFLSNQKNLAIESSYTLSDEEIKAMVRKTIELHFEKEEQNFKNNIKTLSLFFIPSISDFRTGDQKIKLIFEKEYKEIRKVYYDKTKSKTYKAYLDKDLNEQGDLGVHEGYFSGDSGNAEDKIASGVDLILNDKEKLLSFDTSLRFIFSVWALQEGWDNPNIFTICKLATTDKETSRRQQVGRGLRICVNQKGKRLTFDYLNQDETEFYQYNTLDVVVSGYEKDFIREIQSEILNNSYIIAGDYITLHQLIHHGFNSRDAGKIFNVLEDNNIVLFEEDADRYLVRSSIAEFIKTHEQSFSVLPTDKLSKLKEIFVGIKLPVGNGNKPKTKINIRQDKLEQFKALWETINRKATLVYKDIEEASLIKEIAKKFNAETIPPLDIKALTQAYNPKTNTIEDVAISSMGKHSFFDDDMYQNYILNFVKAEKLPLSFVLKLFNKIKISQIKNDPKRAKTLLREIIEEEIHKNIVQKVDYKLCSEINITTSLHKDGTYKTQLLHTELGCFLGNDAPKNFLYDKVVFDSKIEEQAIETDPQSVNNKQITVFAKLPKIAIPTPYKNYNPDFAYLLEGEQGKTIFLVVETKGYNKESNIPPEELKKIEYAEKFFKKLQEETPDNITVIFKKRINKQDLIDILGEV